MTSILELTLTNTGYATGSKKRAGPGEKVEVRNIGIFLDPHLLADTTA